MRIHNDLTMPNLLRVQITLAEKRLFSQVDFVYVDLPTVEHQQLTASNLGVILPLPELDDGTFISECTAITDYLDSIKAGPRLTGKTQKTRISIRAMQKRAEKDLLFPVGNCFYLGVNAVTLSHEVNKGPQQVASPKQKEFEQDRALAGMAYFDDILSHQPYVAGEAFSMADITVWCGLYYADLAKIPIPDTLGSLAMWREKISNRPSIKTLA
jgi:glutathione S-transferase